MHFPTSPIGSRAAVLVVMALASCGGELPGSSSGSGGRAATAPGPVGGAGAAGLGGASGASPGQPVAAGGGGGGGGGGVAGSAGGGPVVDLSAELYDPQRVPRFELALPPESMAALEQQPDVYVRGSLSYQGEQVADIGVRIKGEGSLRTLAEKAAFKLKFDEFVDKQSFRGLRRLTLNNMVEDPTYLAERLAFHFFRELGLPAPRCNHALLYLNGTLMGLYANVETEDKTFLRRWFESDAGNLYEEGQVDFETGNEIAFDLETNEDENDRSDLIALIAALDAAQPASFLDDLGAQLDTKHFLSFTAAEAAVNQWDMYAYTVFYPNNFRLYRDPGTQRFVMLPWGMDMSMKPFRDSGKPHIDVLALARVGDSANRPISAGRIFRECLDSPACREAYVRVVEETATRFEQAGLEALAKTLYEQVKDHIAADPRSEYSSGEVAAALEAQLKVIRERPAAMRASLE